MNIFAELAGNEPFGCSEIVGINARKWGRFRGAWYVAQCANSGPNWFVGPVREISVNFQKYLGTARVDPFFYL